MSQNGFPEGNGLDAIAASQARRTFSGCAPDASTGRGPSATPTIATPIIAVDAMGGDVGPAVAVPGAVAGAKRAGAELILVGNTAVIESELSKLTSTERGSVKVEIVHTDQVVEMHEKPSDVLRRKKDSSIQVACRLVKDGKAHGVVSAGNSGATVASGMFVLGRVEGVERPGLATILPTETKPVIVIDVGANVDSKPYHLFQFSLMANVLAKDVLGRENPTVGLLSIGEEEGKGNYQVKEAYDLLKMASSSINFVGNVEGRDIFTGETDVVVCDGFVGNVVLKLSEGLSMSLARMLKRELTRGLARVGTVLSRGALKRFARFVDYAEYGGAPLLGLNNIVIVCHGASNAKAMSSAVDMAARFVKNRAVEHLTQELTANEELTRYARAAVKP